MKKIVLCIVSLILLGAAIVTTICYKAPTVSVGQSQLRVTEPEGYGVAINALISKYRTLVGEEGDSDAASTYTSACLTFDVGQYINENYAASRVSFGNSHIEVYMTDTALMTRVEMDVVTSVEYVNSVESASTRMKFDHIHDGERELIRMERFDMAHENDFYTIFDYFTDRWLDVEELRDLCETVLKLESFYDQSRTRAAGIAAYREWLDTLSTLFHPYLTNKEKFLSWAAELGEGDFEAFEVLRIVSTLGRELTDEYFDQLETIYRTYLEFVTFGTFKQKNRTYQLDAKLRTGDEEKNNLKFMVDFTAPRQPLMRYSDIYSEFVVKISGVDAVKLPDIKKIKTGSVAARLNVN